MQKENETQVHHVQGHFSAVTSLSLAPDGWSLISAGRDKVVHVWDLRKNTKVVTVPVYEALEGTIAVLLQAVFAKKVMHAQSLKSVACQMLLFALSKTIWLSCILHICKCKGPQHTQC